MMKLLKYLFVIILGLFFCSCELIVDLITDQSQDKITYELKTAFTELSLREDMDLELIESTDSVLIIEGSSEILDKLTITNNEGKVEINFKKTGNWKYDKPSLQLKFPEIVPLRLYKFNNVFALDTLHTDVLYFFSDGTGDIHVSISNQKISCVGTNISNFHISGNTKQLSISTSYSSSFKGARLKAENVNINSFASNNQVVNPIKKLTCTIRQKGNIYYVNQPDELIVNISEDAKGRAIFDKNAK